MLFERNCHGTKISLDFDLFVNTISLNALTETEMFYNTSGVWKMPFRRGLSHMRKKVSD